MNRIRKVEGRWWIYGTEKEAHFGVLSFDPEKGIDLNVKVPRQRTDEEFLRSAADKPEALQVIHGEDAHRQSVMLFGHASFSRSCSAALDNIEIRNVGAAILGCDLSSWEEARFRLAQVDYTPLTKWLGRYVRWGNAEGEDLIKDGIMCLKFRAHEEIAFELSPDVRIRIAGTCLKGGSTDDFRLGWVHSVWFLFPEALSPKTILHEYAYVFMRLLSHLSGEQVFIEELHFWDGDPFKPGGEGPPRHYELIARNSGVTGAERGVHAAQMIASFDDVKGNFGEILNRWFRCHTELKPVLDLYFAVLSNWVLTDETRFLLLVQALEVYHARSKGFCSAETSELAHEQRLKEILENVPKHRDWLEYKLKFANQKALGQRIKDVLDLHGPECERLTKNIPEFPSKVRDSRNYYTHYSERILRDGKVATGLELRRIVYALAAMLEICLLKEIGVQGKPIERVLMRSGR